MIEWKSSQLPVPYPLVVVVSGNPPNPSTYIFYGQFNEHPPVIGIGIKKKRHTYKLIKETGDFTVNFVGRDMLRGADAAGMVSGRRVDKSNFFPWGASSKVKSPIIATAPLSLEVIYLRDIEFTDHLILLGEVKKIWAKKGVKPEDFILATYSPMFYFLLGEKIQDWGFSGGKP